MADWAIRKRNDISDWTLVSGFHDLGGGIQGIEDGEVGVISIALDLTTTSGSGGIVGGQDGFYLDTDTTTPITSEAGLPNGFQMLTFGSAYSYNDFVNILTAQSINVVVTALGVPSSTASSAYSFPTPPDNADLFGAVVVEFTITAPVSGQITYDPSSVGETVFTVGGTYDTLAPGDPVDGFYEISAIAIRGGEDATLKLTNPGKPRGMVIHGNFTEANPFFGYPGHAVSVGNKLYYASGDYEIGVDKPSIRVWDGETDTEVCKIPQLPPPQALDSAVPIAITCMVPLGDKYIIIGVWNAGTGPSDLVGSLYRLKLSDGSLRNLVFSSASGGGVGHIPSCLAAYGDSSFYVGSHRGDASSPGAIWQSSGDLVSLATPPAFNLLVDLSGTGQGSVVSLELGTYDEVGNVIFGTSAPSGTFAKVGQYVHDYPVRLEDLMSGTGGTAQDYNGFYALRPYAPAADNTPGGPFSFMAAYWNPDTTPISEVFVGSSTNNVTPVPRTSIFSDPAGAQIMSLIVDGGGIKSNAGGTTFRFNWTGINNGVPYSTILPYGPVLSTGTIYLLSAKRVAGVYSGTIAYLNSPEDVTDWHVVTTQFPLSGDGVTLASRAPTNAFGVVSS